MTQTHQYSPGDSVLASYQGNQIPGVVMEVEGDRVLVSLAQPYVDQKAGGGEDQIWCSMSDVQPLIAESAAGELPPAT